MTSTSSESIRNISYTKLQEIQHTRTEPSIRKYVLIVNMLRASDTVVSTDQDEPMPSLQDDKDEDEDIVLEQEWLDTCLDALEDDDDDNNRRTDTHQSIPHSPYASRPQANARQLAAATEINDDTSMNDCDNHFPQDQTFPASSSGIYTLFPSLNASEHPTSSQLTSSSTSSTTVRVMNDFSLYNNYLYRNLCGTWSIL